jgi:cytochrome c oxidase subunit III
VNGVGTAAERSSTVAERSSVLEHHFRDLEQQRDASTLGMWIFLATEVMFFGVLFLGYTAYRVVYYASFAEGSHHLKLLLGSVNTAVLLSSSLTMALAIHAAQLGRSRALVGFLLMTMLLGAAFLGIKALEYYYEYEEHLVPGLNFAFSGPNPGHVEIFFILYFFMTGLHAFHLTVGIGLVAVIAFLAWRGRYTSEYHTPVELTGLYWHFVDVIWVFLFPLLYLIDLYR